MNIYTVKPDPDFRLMFPEDSVYESENWEFKAKPLAGKIPLHFQAHLSETNDKPIPDIAWIGMTTFAFRKDVATELLDILEDAGELLPFQLDGDVWCCLNVLKSSENAVDPVKSSYEIDDGEVRFGLKKPFFNLDNLPSSSLFKIKEDNYTNIYCIDKRNTEEDVLNNFFCAIASHKFTGIKFEKLTEA